MDEYSMQVLQLVIAALGPLATFAGFFFLMRRMRLEEKTVAVQEQSALSTATRDEFTIMDMLQKQQHATIQELRAANSEIRKTHYDSELENAKKFEAMKLDFKREMEERDAQRKAEVESFTRELDRLRGDLSKSQDRIKELESQLKSANEEIRTTKGNLASITQELALEREKNAILTARIVELESKQQAAEEANHKSESPLPETKA